MKLRITIYFEISLRILANHAITYTNLLGQNELFSPLIFNNNIKVQ